jgi:hypothetical protein
MVASKPSSTTRKEMKVPKNPFWIEIRSKGTLGLRDHVYGPIDKRCWKMTGDCLGISSIRP